MTCVKTYWPAYIGVPAIKTSRRGRKTPEKIQVDNERKRHFTENYQLVTLSSTNNVGTPVFQNLNPDGAIWQVPAARMKLRLHYKDDEERDHWVPLSRQAADIIETLRGLTGRTPYLFPNQRHAHRPASENAIGYLLNRAGYHHRHVPHGWRATFSTVMNERFKHDRHIIDLMLAHVPANAVEGAYNRAGHLDRRIELAQAWADLIMVDQMPIDDLVNLRRRSA